MHMPGCRREPPHHPLKLSFTNLGSSSRVMNLYTMSKIWTNRQTKATGHNHHLTPDSATSRYVRGRGNRKNSPTQGEPTSSERGIRPTRGGRGSGRPTPGGGGMGGRGRTSLGNRGGGRSSSSVGKTASLHSADGSAVRVSDGHTHDGTKPLPKKVEKESRTDKPGKKTERRPESKKKSGIQRPSSPTSTLSGSDSGEIPPPRKPRDSGPDPPGGGGGSDGSNRKKEVRLGGDAVWLQYPRRSQPPGNKKVLPHKELRTLALEMFDEAGNGVPLHEDFLRRVYEVATTNLRECVSLLDFKRTALPTTTRLRPETGILRPGLG